MSRCRVKGWVHLENLYLQEAPYSPRQAPHSFRLRLNLHTDHSSLERPDQTCYNLSSWESRFQIDPTQGSLHRLLCLRRMPLIGLSLRFRWPAPSRLPVSNVSASLQPPSYTLYHNFLHLFTSTRPYLLACCNLVESPRERESRGGSDLASLIQRSMPLRSAVRNTGTR